MEFNKPVSNPMMVGSIELLKAEDTPEHRQMFLDEKQFKTWCDYHYSVCREQSVLGASNHVIIIGRK